MVGKPDTTDSDEGKSSVNPAQVSDQTSACPDVDTSVVPSPSSFLFLMLRKSGMVHLCCPGGKQASLQPG